jgi:hypothetical protein
MARVREQENASEAPGGRWQRRALRHAAERRRLPKHGKTYVDLVERMLAERARAASATVGSTEGNLAPRHRARQTRG